MKYIKLPGLLLCLLSLAACNTIKEDPDSNPLDPTLIEVSFSLEVNMSIDELEPVTTYASILEGDHDIRYIVDIYRESGNRSPEGDSPVERIVYTDDEIREGRFTIDNVVKIPADRYRLLIWVDFVRKGTTTDLYYNTQDLHAVSIIRDNGYVGYTTTKDAFTTSVEMDLTPYRGKRFVHFPLAASVVRPFGVYRIITTDIEKYMSYHSTLSYASIRPSIAKFSYQSPFPTGYNVLHGVPDVFKMGIGYRYDITELVPQSEALVASDMVFINANEAGYDVGFEICTPDGAHINTINGLRINLRRNKLTIVRGEYLTRELGGGGIGIDPGFEDEIIVPIN